MKMKGGGKGGRCCNEGVDDLVSSWVGHFVATSSNTGTKPTIGRLVSNFY